MPARARPKSASLVGQVVPLSPNPDEKPAEGEAAAPPAVTPSRARASLPKRRKRKPRGRVSRAKAGAQAAGLKGWTYTFIAELARTYGDVSAAAAKAGKDRKQAYRERDENPAFAETWDEAVDDFKDRLAARMRQRAIFGDLEPLIRKGKRFGNIRKFDTTLQIFLARNGRPAEFNLAPGDTREAGDGARKLGSQICDAIDKWRELVPAAPAIATEATEASAEPPP